MGDVIERTVPLADGRRIGYYEFGDPEGVPCVYTPGWPASGLLGGVYDEAARAAGVRWISVDKPGIGKSDFDPKRSLARYADDVRQLADHLGFDRFGTVGESGGGPHALALSRFLPDRLTTVILVAAIGPAHEKWVREGMKPLNKFLFFAAQRAPWLLRAHMWMLGRTLKDPKKAERFERMLLRDAPEADRRAFAQVDTSWLVPAAAAALADGGRAATQELTMIARPWGFALSDITVPVRIWHGTEDRNAPLAVARRAFAALPIRTEHFIEGEGHAIGVVVRTEMMAAVTRAATSTPHE
jgi:pimeloyl-ACP methyl ester carboxylesterase